MQKHERTLAYQGSCYCFGPKGQKRAKKGKNGKEKKQNVRW